MNYHEDPVHKKQESEAAEGRREKLAASTERFFEYLGEKMTRYRLSETDVKSARLVADTSLQHYRSHSVRILLGAALLAARERDDRYAATSIQASFSAVFESLSEGETHDNA